MVIPFTSWDGAEDLEDNSAVQALEKLFGECIVTNNHQLGVQLCLEVLGSRTAMIPVVMPVTASPDTLSAVLRAGCHPILLDIDPLTLEMDTYALSASLEELKGAVVLLTCPLGMPAANSLLEAAKVMPVIIDTGLAPVGIQNEDLLGTFNVFDLGPVVGSGAVVFPTYKQQLQDMKLLRSHYMGHAGHPSRQICEEAIKRLTSSDALGFRKKTTNVVAKYREVLTNLGHKNMFGTCSNTPRYVPVFVTNSVSSLERLAAKGVSAKHLVYPLHYLAEVKRRYKEPPSYPVAEELFTKTLALPAHPGMLDKVEYVVESLLEAD